MQKIMKRIMAVVLLVSMAVASIGIVPRKVEASTTYQYKANLRNLLSDYQYVVKENLEVKTHTMGGVAVGGNCKMADFADAMVSPSYAGNLVKVGNVKDTPSTGVPEGYHTKKFYYTYKAANAFENYQASKFEQNTYLDMVSAFHTIQSESTALVSGAEKAVVTGNKIIIDFSKAKKYEVPANLISSDRSVTLDIVGLASPDDLRDEEYSISITGLKNTIVFVDFGVTSKPAAADKILPVTWDGQPMSNKLKKISSDNYAGAQFVNSGMKLIWNFPDATKMMTEYISGHFVAPQADLTISGGNFEGGVIAKSVTKTTISPPIIAPWILMNQIPVVNEWQAPETFGELLVACEKQHINIMCILQNIVSKIRDGKRHLLLIGFPVPRFFGGDPEIISWKALYLPTVSYGKRTAKGFRNNQQGWWMRDRCEVFTKNAKLDWIVSENWNQHEISQRGKMSDLLLRKRILLIGAGCIGASIAEIFVRAGVYNITIADSDIFEVGNLSRHILNLNNIGEFKELSVCNYLNSLNPHANVKVINDTLSNDDSFKTNIDLDRYDVIVDCTGENNVLDILQSTNFKRTHIIASVSVGLGAKRLYVTLMNGNTFNFNAFYDLISPYLQAEKVLYDDYDLPRNGIGCWHPTFPGRSDDIWIAAATSVKVIENYIISKSQKTLSLIYEQKESDGIFESYEVVEKREDG